MLTSFVCRSTAAAIRLRVTSSLQCRHSLGKWGLGQTFLHTLGLQMKVLVLICNLYIGICVHERQSPVTGGLEDLFCLTFACLPASFGVEGFARVFAMLRKQVPGTIVVCLGWYVSEVERLPVRVEVLG